MFYTKNKLRNGKTVKTVISQHNVVTHCPECGREFHVDLAEFTKHGCFKLYNAEVVCKDCSRKFYTRKAETAEERLLRSIFEGDKQTRRCAR